MLGSVIARFLLLLILVSGALQYAGADVPSSAKDGLQFIVVGDWGTPDSDGQRQVAAGMDKLAAMHPIDFIATTGDNFYHYGVKSADDPRWFSSFENVYTLPALKDVPWYPTLGNHDHMGNVYAQVEYGRRHANWILPGTYHSAEFSIGGQNRVLLLFIDTSPFIGSYRAGPELIPGLAEHDVAAQINWIVRTLKGSSATWRIVLGHHPIYSSDRQDDTLELRQILSGIFEQHKVQAYFAGHDHYLEHYRTVDSTHYFISGAGSRPRSVTRGQESLFTRSSLGFAHVLVTDACLSVRFINEAGIELYKTGIAKRTGGECRQSAEFDKNILHHAKKRLDIDHHPRFDSAAFDR